MTAGGSHAAVTFWECFTMKNSLALRCVARSSLCLALVGVVSCSKFVLADLPPLSPAAMANGATVTRVAGFEFVGIGGLGNAPVPREMQVGFQYRPQLAAVDYNYAVSRTEVTYDEYLPFVRAYVTHFDPLTTPGFALQGDGILFAGGDDRDPQNYYLRPGYEHTAANVGYRFGARYCNWLNNDRANTAAALSTGAYVTPARFCPMTRMGHKTMLPACREQGFSCPRSASGQRRCTLMATGLGPDRQGTGSSPQHRTMFLRLACRRTVGRPAPGCRTLEFRRRYLLRVTQM